MSEVERFLAKVKKTESCWLWTDRLNMCGYGSFYYKGKSWRAHRWALVFISGVANQEKLVVCHKCDVTYCVNPEHLFFGTPKQNTHDSMKKGRWNSEKRKAKTVGENNHKARLKEYQVVEIIEMIHKGISYKEIGLKFKIDRDTVSGIKCGRRWKTPLVNAAREKECK